MASPAYPSTPTNSLRIIPLVQRTLPEEIFLIDFGGGFDASGTLEFFVRTGGLASYVSFPEADELIDRAGTTTDPDVREQALARVQKIIKEEPIAIYSHLQNKVYGLNNRVQWERRADDRIPVRDINFG